MKKGKLSDLWVWERWPISCLVVWGAGILAYIHGRQSSPGDHGDTGRRVGKKKEMRW